ncbi:type VI secretion system-associated FHA domain protein [Polyangium aurulentum]|uniref:type VI secretion system-associated FHA domain protein n=1 Tax=Polyangium aurulentum TaxID=2567896 RepID=UPI00146C5103|nr:type VI secretion system-associated FHA domain protein [Polyangium aurulentum]UQA55632.1 FHA domain-containing protein [Polyangium aurulentum]
MPVALVARIIDTQANQSFDQTFERFPVRIGRNQLNDLQIDRPYVSQFHAAIDLKDRQIIVKDLGSTNGTVFAGRRLVRDAPTDITNVPEIAVGPIVIRMQLVDAAPKKREEPKDGTVLDFGDAAGGAVASLRPQKPIAPGAEDAYIRQLGPYIEAYRTAWGGIYRVIYDHLPRLTPEVQQNYLKRLSMEQPAIAVEKDFQKLSLYYGVDPRMIADPSPAQAAHAAIIELARTLAPGSKPLEDVESVLTFARKLRDAMEVFLKCFVSLRDGYQEFEAEVLARDRANESDRVATAKDEKELGNVLLGPAGGPDAPRQLQNIFVDVMSHQVALINGVMEGVRTLLTKLSPKKIEEELEKRGKKGGLFSNKFEALWKLYEVVHGDYSGEEKETFLIIFGPQFSRAYAATAGEDEGAGGEAGAKNRGRFTLSANQLKR